MLEKIAALQHEIWCHWMKYLFEVSIHNRDGTITIPVDKVNRWKRQMTTKYDDLPDSEKTSDREQSAKVIAMISITTKITES